MFVAFNDIQILFFVISTPTKSTLYKDYDSFDSVVKLWIHVSYIVKYRSKAVLIIIATQTKSTFYKDGGIFYLVVK